MYAHGEVKHVRKPSQLVQKTLSASVFSTRFCREKLSIKLAPHYLPKSAIMNLINSLLSTVNKAATCGIYIGS